MNLECPSCQTRYLVDPAALGAGGGTVRCARCRHSWFEKPPAESLDRPDLAEAIEAPRPIPRGSSLPAGRREQRGANWVGWLVLVVVVGAVIAGGVFAREQIVAAWPPAAKLYELVRLPLEGVRFGLDLRNVRSSQQVEDGVLVLSVEGEVVNISRTAQRVPKLRVLLHDEKQRELVTWLVSAPRSRLEPGESVAFSTRREKPPPDARGLVVSFASGG
jgi:predicted Zn finger-like uncharacterized protein